MNSELKTTVIYCLTVVLAAAVYLILPGNDMAALVGLVAGVFVCLLNYLSLVFVFRKLVDNNAFLAVRIMILRYLLYGAGALFCVMSGLTQAVLFSAAVILFSAALTAGTFERRTN